VTIVHRQVEVNDILTRSGTMAMVIDATGDDAKIPEWVRTVAYNLGSKDVYLSPAMFEQDEAKWLADPRAEGVSVFNHDGHIYYPVNFIIEAHPECAEIALGMRRRVLATVKLKLN